MKKFILVALAALFVCSAVDAQFLRADELEKYAKEKYGEKWVDAATNLGTQLTLDKTMPSPILRLSLLKARPKISFMCCLTIGSPQLSMMQTPSSN